jgi:hypothetical protein
MADSNSTGPSYYRRGDIQVWDFIRDQGLNFHLGNAIKYICRAGYKDSKVQDLTKAIHYLQNELENEILHQSASKGVQSWFPSEEQYDASFTEYAAEFDR